MCGIWRANRTLNNSDKRDGPSDRMNATDSTNWRYSADNNERATENGKDRAVPDKNHKSHRAPFALGEVQVYPSRNEKCARGERGRLQPQDIDALREPPPNPTREQHTKDQEAQVERLPHT